MSMALQRAAVRTRVQSVWNTAVYGPMYYENFDGPYPTLTPFTEMEFIPGQSRQESIGGPGQNLYRYYDILQFSVYGPQNVGVAQLDTVCELLILTFRGWSTLLGDGEKLTFRSPSIYNRGKASGRYIRIVSCPFYRDSYG